MSRERERETRERDETREREKDRDTRERERDMRDERDERKRKRERERGGERQREREISISSSSACIIMHHHASSFSQTALLEPHLLPDPGAGERIVGALEGERGRARARHVEQHIAARHADGQGLGGGCVLAKRHLFV